MYTAVKVIGWILIAFGIIITAFNLLGAFTSSSNTYPWYISLAGSMFCLVPFCVLGAVLIVAADGREKAVRRRRGF